MPKRIEKINSLITRELGKIIHDEGYEEITGLVTVTKTTSTADLSEARVSVSVVGQDEGEVLNILKKNIYEIQGMLNKQLVLRKVPRIQFMLDDASVAAQKITKLIDEART